jgi:hypothetical protein
MGRRDHIGQIPYSFNGILQAKEWLNIYHRDTLRFLSFFHSTQGVFRFCHFKAEVEIKRLSKGLVNSDEVAKRLCGKSPFAFKQSKEKWLYRPKETTLHSLSYQLAFKGTTLNERQDKPDVMARVVCYWYD